MSPAPGGRVMPLSRKNTKKALPYCAGLQNMEKMVDKTTKTWYNVNVVK